VVPRGLMLAPAAEGTSVIVFDLSCENRHRFEGWFASSEDFERQAGGHQIACPMCGNANVERLPSATRFNSGSREPAERREPGAGADPQYTNASIEAISRLVASLIESTDDVGSAFPEEARKIHYQEVPARRIRGTASSEEVHALKEEGIEVVALPVPAHRTGKTH
jgi:hypothetical protein